MKLFIIFCLLCCVLASDKYISIKGKLLCGAHPAFNILLRLWPVQEETGYDVLAEEFTTRDGTFFIKGKVFTDKNYVVLKIYHDCGDGMKPGQRKFNFFIPTKYATDKENGEPFEFGELNLETKFRHNEERDEETSKRRRRKNVSFFNKKRVDESAKYDNPDERIEPW